MNSPVIAILHNRKLERWHPIIFTEWPLPGPPAASKPVRYKSAAHHRLGFKTRAQALVAIESQLQKLDAKPSFVEDIPWEGEGVPAMMAFFVQTERGLELVDAGDQGYLADAHELLNRVLQLHSEVREDSLEEEWPDTVGESGA